MLVATIICAVSVSDPTRRRWTGSEVFFLSALQMSVSKRCAHWYPQWHLLRRTLINVFYLMGLQRGGEVQSWITLYYAVDWRVMLMGVLTICTMLQYHFNPFRDDDEDRLEMWGLQFLMIMVVIDFGDEKTGSNTGSLVMGALLTVVFMMITTEDYWSDHKREVKGMP